MNPLTPGCVPTGLAAKRLRAMIDTGVRVIQPDAGTVASGITMQTRFSVKSREREGDLRI